MSAITGIINLDGSPVDRALLGRMADVASHRGPDGIVNWVGGPVGLAHLRLTTTVQEKNETQPFVSPDGRYVVVLDGRIDNRSELYSKLASSGSFSAESTDVEMLLAAYEYWGKECVSKIVGDFAFVIWDSITRSAFGARDPIGVRMFHYYVDASVFVFGTEIKQLLVHPAVSVSLNKETLALYLCGITRWGDRTFYEGVKRLPGGNTFELASGRLRISEYWDPDPWDQIVYPNPREYYEHYNELVLQAVGSRLRSSSPIAITLSGGLDSGVVATVASNLVRNTVDVVTPELRGYHWNYSGSPVDDAPAVEAVAKAADIDVRYVSTEDFWAMKPVERSVKPDEPFIFHFESMQYKTMELFGQAGHRVVLDGEGGDEAASPGYMLYLKDWLFRGKFASIWTDLRQGNAGYREAGRQFLLRSLFGPLIHMFRKPSFGVPSWLEPSLVDELDLSQLIQNQKAHTYRESNYTQHRGFPPFFVGLDRVAAEHQIEVRHPLWDSRLVEFLTRIPPTVRFQGDWGKTFMKQAMVSTVPPEVLNRVPEGSFGDLMMTGLRRRETSRLREQIANSRLARMNIVRGDVFSSVFESYISGDDSKWARLYWTLATDEWLADMPQLVEPAGIKA